MPFEDNDTLLEETVAALQSLRRGHGFRRESTQLDRDYLEAIHDLVMRVANPTPVPPAGLPAPQKTTCPHCGKPIKIILGP